MNIDRQNAMKMYLMLAIVLAISNANAQTVVGNRCKFGKDELAFPRAFALPTAEEKSQFSKAVPNVIGKQIENAHLPLREGVSCWTSPRMGMIARENEEFTIISWDNIGFFIRPVRTVDEAMAVLLLFHPNFTEIKRPAFQKIVEEISSGAVKQPFSIEQKEVEENSLARGSFEENGIWFVHFLCVEEASVNEYKYLINKEGKIARLKRVLIKGPARVNNNWEWVTAGGRWTPEWKKKLQEWLECREYLESKAHDRPLRPLPPIPEKLEWGNH